MSAQSSVSCRLVPYDVHSVPLVPVPHVDLQAEYTFTNIHSQLPAFTFGAAEVRKAVDACWNSRNTETNYQPQHIDFSFFLSDGSLNEAEVAVMADLSELCSNGARLMHAHRLREGVHMLESRKEGSPTVAAATARAVMSFLKDAQGVEELSERGVVKARLLNDLYIGLGWLEKYFLFQDYDKTGDARAPYIPKHTIALPYTLTAKLFGNQEEFTYYNHYVGASCRNMEEMRKWMKEKVDFSAPSTIAAWVLGFDSLYDFQIPANKDWLVSERYFRFIHLAMEMVWSEHAERILGMLGEAMQRARDLASSGAGGKGVLHVQGLSGERLVVDGACRRSIQQALSTLLDVERNMNLTFKSLPMGSNPAHYNSYVRPFIAGTWGRNCGTVFYPQGKFFEGCGAEKAEVDGGRPVYGKWKMHVGQTGAGTSVRPIADEFAGGVSEVYTKPISPSFCGALMCDQQAKVQRMCAEAILEPTQRSQALAPGEEEENVPAGSTLTEAEQKFYSEMLRLEAETRLTTPAVTPLTLMLTMFRAVTRPYSHNQQIATAKALHDSIQPIIDACPELQMYQVRLQVAALTHRIDHYQYVQLYINEHKAAGAQLRTAATGGSDTTDFLPDLIDTNLTKAHEILGNLEETVTAQLGPMAGMLTDVLHEMKGKLTQFDAVKSQIKTYSQEIKESEREENEGTICECGNFFMPDANFCRKCGRARSKAPPTNALASKL